MQIAERVAPCADRGLADETRVQGAADGGAGG